MKPESINQSVRTNRGMMFGFLTAAAMTAGMGSAAQAAGKVARCEDVFKAQAATEVVAAVAAPKPEKVEKTAKTAKSLGVFEIITSIYNGSQLYAIRMSEPGKPASETEPSGLYNRDGRTWKLMIPGEIMLNAQGAPLIEQLAIGKTAKESYIVTVIDGNIYLLTSHSKLSAPTTFIQFGSKQSPLFEVGSLQKRLLGPGAKDTSVSIYQDPVLTEKGSQLVLVSLKFAQHQAVGEGMTFAFEVFPNKAAAIQLNGKPVVLDYEFHETSFLSEMTMGQKKKILFSKILLEQFDNSDLSFFDSHVRYVRDFLTDVTNRALRSISPSLFLSSPEERIAFGITEGKIERDITFKRRVFGDGPSAALQIEQHYQISRGQSEIVIRMNGNEAFRLPGKIDLLKNNTAAAWSGENENEIMFSVGGKLFMLFQKANREGVGTRRAARAEEMALVEIGVLSSPSRKEGGNIPTDLYFVSHLQTGGNIEKGTVVLTAKLQDGGEMTTAVQMKVLLHNIVQPSAAFGLLNYKLVQAELIERLKLHKNDDPLFDTVTPKMISVAAYDQAYDASKPHVNLITSEARKLAYNFKQPSSTREIAPKLNYAEFSSIAGIDNPSGLYFNIPPEKITGNETTRVVGQLLPRPHSIVDETQPQKHFIFAQIEASPKKTDAKDDEETEGAYGYGTGGPAYKLRLFGVDATHRSGISGYKLSLLIENPKGEIVPKPVEIGKSTWLSNLSYFKDAVFIQGRRSDRDFVYMFLSFATQGEMATSKTFVYRINITKPEESVKVSSLDMLITPKDLQEILGFDEGGYPSLMLSPELSQDARQFAVFDLRKGAKEFPNQASGPKRKFKFGDFKSGTLAHEESYVNAHDSWAAFSSDIKKKYGNLGRSNELAQFDSFAALGRQLDAMSSTKVSPQRVILVVPESLRGLVWDFILTKGFNSERPAGGKAFDHTQSTNQFNHLNRKLSINVIDSSKSTQNQVLANLESWIKGRAARPEDRIFTVGRMDDILSVNGGKPESGDEVAPFTLNYVRSGNEADLDITDVASATSNILPSTLYMMAAEKPMQLRDFRHLSTPPSASVLVVATPAEMKQIETSMAAEIENGLLDQYTIQEIKDPDHDSMASSLADIFANEKVLELDYKFSAKEIQTTANLNSQESYGVVIEYAISRFTSLLETKKDSRFESFMRFRAAFAQAVLSDKEARKKRVLDKAFVERVMTQVFDIPMNLATLPADDPMVILSKPDALLKLQQAGYSGPFDLKARVRDTITSQTRAESGKPVPSSIILFGNTGAGKTFLYKSLVKMLGLRQYDFNHGANNNDAQAITINVGQLKEKDGGDRDGDMDVNQALKHLDTIIATPNGYRSWILLDDVHSANDAIKTKVLTWVRAMFESQDGMYTVQGPKGPIRRPVRNLNLFMTLNPTVDQDQIAKYAKDKGKPTSEEVLVATLSSSSYKIEPSFLRRWGQIINLDFMPAGAKGPELIKKITDASAAGLNNQSRIVLVDPVVVTRLVATNEKVDARSFLSASTNALIEAASSANAKGALVLVVPSLTRMPPRVSSFSSGEDNASEKISSWVMQNTQTLSLDATLDGNLAFTKTIADAFRMPLYESLTLALQEDSRFAGRGDEQSRVLAPILAAIADHLTARPYISLADLNLNASEFGLVTRSDREVFKTAVAKQATNAGPLFPLGFKVINSAVSTWREIDGRSTSREIASRKQVLADLVLKNREVLRLRMASVMRVENLDLLPDPGTWLTRLDPQVGPDAKVLGQALVENLWDYLPQILNPDLADNRMPGIQPLSIYAAARLYMYSIDRAMVQMNWVQPSKFLLESLKLITQNQVLSQRPGVQTFLFKDPHRLIKPTLPDFTFQVIASSHATERIEANTRQRQLVDFEKNVEHYISPLTPLKPE